MYNLFDEVLHTSRLFDASVFQGATTKTNSESDGGLHSLPVAHFSRRPFPENNQLYGTGVAQMVDQGSPQKLHLVTHHRKLGQGVTTRHGTLQVSSLYILVAVCSARPQYFVLLVGQIHLVMPTIFDSYRWPFLRVVDSPRGSVSQAYLGI